MELRLFPSTALPPEHVPHLGKDSLGDRFLEGSILTFRWKFCQMTFRFLKRDNRGVFGVQIEEEGQVRATASIEDSLFHNNRIAILSSSPLFRPA
jgi:hypothetical protein